MAEGGGAGTLWATAAVMFAGALLTGLPAVWWTVPEAEAEAAADKTSGGRRGGGGGGGAMRLAQALLQGPGARALTAGLMLGSGLGVVLPEGFFAFVEGAPQGGGGLGEWAAGAALVAGFAGMLVLQLVLDGWVAGGSSSSGAGAAAFGGRPAPLTSLAAGAGRPGSRGAVGLLPSAGGSGSSIQTALATEESAAAAVDRLLRRVAAAGGAAGGMARAAIRDATGGRRTGGRGAGAGAGGGGGGGGGPHPPPFISIEM